LARFCGKRHGHEVHQPTASSLKQAKCENDSGFRWYIVEWRGKTVDQYPGGGHYERKSS
jgi:hypothetical protein